MVDQSSEHPADVFDFGVQQAPRGGKAVITFAGPGGLMQTRQVVGAEDPAVQAKAERWLRRRAFAEGTLRADVLNALMARYELELPVFVARRLAGRLIEIYRHVLGLTLEQDGPAAIAVDVPHLEAVTDEGGRRTVRIVRERFDANQIAESVRGWLAPVIGAQAAGIAETVLIRYALWTWESLHLDAEIDAMLDRGVAPTVRLAALSKAVFREQARPWFEELASELTAMIGESLQLRRARLTDLERLMGLRAQTAPGELLAYREDDGSIPETAHLA
jgi:hypothetical protein